MSRRLASQIVKLLRTPGEDSRPPQGGVICSDSLQNRVPFTACLVFIAAHLGQTHSEGPSVDVDSCRTSQPEGLHITKTDVLQQAPAGNELAVYNNPSNFFVKLAVRDFWSLALKVQLKEL